MKRKFILLISILAISITACSNPNDNSETGGDVSAKEKVTVWAWDQKFNVAAMEEAKKIYELENPDVEIEILEFAQADIVQKLNTGLSAGTSVGLPNIVLIEDMRIQGFLNSYQGSFKDLTGLVDHNNFAQYKIKSMSLEDKIFGVPFDTGVSVMYYRQDIIEEAGYTEEDMTDMTWEKYIEIGKAVKNKTGKYMLTLDPNDIGQILMMMQSAGEWFTKEDGFTLNFEGNDALKEALIIYKEMMDSDIAMIISDWAQFVAAPNSGDVATVPTGNWFTPSIVAQEDQSGLWRVASIPRLGNIPSSINASNLGGSSWYILENVSGAEASLDFINKTFGTSREFYENMLNNHGIIGTYIPAKTSESYAVSSDFFGGQQVVADIVRWTEMIPAVNNGLHTRFLESIVKSEIQGIMSGTNIEDAIINAQKQAESQIQ
jgi:lactose/L-arabinose transport system substrate-binding protein